MDNHRFQTYPSAVWIYLIGVKRFPLFSDWPRLLPMSSRNRNWHLAARYAVFAGSSSFGFLISGCVVDLKLNTVGVCSTELNSAYCRTQWWRRAGKKEILGGSFFFVVVVVLLLLGLAVICPKKKNKRGDGDKVEVTRFSVCVAMKYTFVSAVHSN